MGRPVGQSWTRGDFFPMFPALRSICARISAAVTFTLGVDDGFEHELLAAAPLIIFKLRGISRRVNGRMIDGSGPMEIHELSNFVRNHD